MIYNRAVLRQVCPFTIPWPARLILWTDTCATMKRGGWRWGVDGERASDQESTLIYNREALESILNPTSVAVVGAAPGNLGQLFVDIILGHGFPGRVYPVHPR